MEQKKLLFALNPHAGRSEIRQKVLAVCERFRGAGYDIQLFPTAKNGELPDEIARLAPGMDLVVCCGGDGTLNETVSGLMRLEQRPTLGYLPAGTVNDFASGLGIPKEIEAAVEVVLNGSPFDCDIGRFGERYFTYVAACGAFTEVAYQTPQTTKNMLGRMAYILEGAKRLTALKPFAMRLAVEETVCEGEFIFGMISNATSVGGLRLPQDARVAMNDGQCEVLFIRNPSSIQDAQQVVNAVLRHDYSSPLVVAMRASKLVVQASEPVSWTVDGEYGGTLTDVEIENIPRALRVLIA